MMRPRLRGIMRRATAWPTKKHAVEIGAHQLAPGLLRVVFKRAAPLDAGVVDENVDRPEGRFDLLDRMGDRGAVGDVEDGFADLGADGAQLGRGFRHFRPRSPVDHDFRAGAGEATRQRETDASRRPRNQRDRAIQSEQFFDQPGHKNSVALGSLGAEVMAITTAAAGKLSPLARPLAAIALTGTG